MFKLSVEFKTTQELADFIVKLGGAPTSLKVEEEKEVPKEKKAKKVEEKKEAPVMVEAPAVVPPELPAKPAFDRGAAITLATETIKELTTLGVSGADLAQHLANLYTLAQCPIGVKISQLDDEQLAKFLPLFTEKASELKKPAQNASFI